MEWIYAVVVLLAVLWLMGWRSRARQAGFPHSYNLERPKHVAIIDEVRERYATAMADQSNEFADCMFKPADLLPYPKDEIRKALTALLDFAEGRRDSTLLDEHIRSPSIVQVLRGSLMQLETYLDVPAADIPHDPDANREFGLRWVQRREKE